MSATGCTVTPSTVTTACSAQPSGSATTRRLPWGASMVVRVPAFWPVVSTSRAPSGVSSRSRGGATRSWPTPVGLTRHISQPSRGAMRCSPSVASSRRVTSGTRPARTASRSVAVSANSEGPVEASPRAALTRPATEPSASATAGSGRTTSDASRPTKR